MERQRRWTELININISQTGGDVLLMARMGGFVCYFAIAVVLAFKRTNASLEQNSMSSDGWKTENRYYYILLNLNPEI